MYICIYVYKRGEYICKCVYIGEYICIYVYMYIREASIYVYMYI